jgi:hypothetical protein
MSTMSKRFQVDPGDGAAGSSKFGDSLLSDVQ